MSFLLKTSGPVHHPQADDGPCGRPVGLAVSDATETGAPKLASSQFRQARLRARSAPGEAGIARGFLLISSEIFLTILTGLIFAVAFLHLLLGILELAALLALIGAVSFASVLRLEWRRTETRDQRVEASASARPKAPSAPADDRAEGLHDKIRRQGF